MPAPAATVSAPLTTWSLIPSFGVGLADGTPKSRSLFVSLSQKRTVGSPWPLNSSRPSQGWSVTTVEAPPTSSSGFVSSGSPQPHVFRYQAVGSTCSVSESGPAFVTRIVISRSCGSAFA